ncbi:hypothetical protein M8W91_001516 [Salmonella enterica]|nr:hypothetical protein [Salmonella enterica]EJF5855439.1 hypothetical protein [Salmonella enterica]EJF5945792.1 hypothetical protein [Salmonella enterica]EJF6157192.1 hypothetical protein [Salmonella enterica]EJF6374719.1 hypothetical protein [Salmonella enterica]
MMNLKNQLICNLLQYASDNNYFVELRTDCAVVDGLHGFPVYVVFQPEKGKGWKNFFNYSPVLIYKGEIKEGCQISYFEFKRIFARR